MTKTKSDRISLTVNTPEDLKFLSLKSTVSSVHNLNNLSS